MDQLTRLRFLDVSVSMAVRNGLTALATKHFLDWQFYGLSEEVRRQVYQTNPANNFLYQANEAMIDSSVVELLENVKAEDRRDKLPFSIPDLAELRRHRIVISHPGTIFFSEKPVQDFFDNREHYRDEKKALRFFRTREALAAKIVELGGRIDYPTAVAVQAGTSELIQGVLCVALRDRKTAPPVEEIAKAAFPYFAAYEKGIRSSTAVPRS